MADYDVAALALASPPTSTPPATYTPAISVKNNGIHEAVASGWLSFYRKSSGVLVATFNVLSGTLQPGATGNATATGTLDLSDELVGEQFIATGYVSTPNDQVPSNNQLQPVTLTISAEPPPPPPPVAAHASQHEEGGSDVLSVDGLHGKLSDEQEPTAHASRHEAGAEDELNLTGLTGEMVTPQPPKLHSSTHEPGGSDPITGIAPATHHESHEPGGDDALEGYALAADVPAEGAPQQWLPRLIETKVATPGLFTGEGIAPNIGGIVAALHEYSAQLYNGDSRQVTYAFTIPEGKNRDLILHIRAGLRVVGSSQLDVSPVVTITTPLGTYNLLNFGTINFPAGVDADSAIVDCDVLIHQQSEGVWGYSSAGYVSYPSGSVTPNQQRDTRQGQTAFYIDDAVTVMLDILVANGDANNYIWLVGAYIELVHYPISTES